MADRRITLSVERSHDVLRHNFVANALDGALFAFALSLVSMHTVVPVFVKKMGGSNVAVGLIPVVWTIGFNFPQILIANYAQRFRSKKRLLLKTAIGQRIPWLLLAVVSYFWVTEDGSDVGLVLFFTLFALAAVGGSINLPVWFDLIAKITPVHLRGRLFAARSILGAILGVVGGWIVRMVLDSFPYRDSFALMLFLAFGVMMISYVFLAILKEENGVAPEPRVDYRHFLHKLPDILEHERNYRNFLIADALLITATMAHAFFAVNAIEKFDLSDLHAGTFTIAMMTGMIIGSLVFGFLADRFGHRLNLLLSAGSTAIACTVALIAPNVEFYLIVFVGSAFTVGLVMISRLPLIAELSPERQRPTYGALSNFITSPFVLSGILAGWLANHFGYNVVFFSGGALAMVASVWLMAMVDDPRKKARKQNTQAAEYS